jgi:hypothetical protein
MGLVALWATCGWQYDSFLASSDAGKRLAMSYVGCCCCPAGEYKYGWHALPRAFTRGETRIISGRASCEYGIRRRSIDAYNVSVQKR